jgi:Beta-lactamase superfamily domain
MFSVTYLGHQGWVVSGEHARILIDPLITDEYSPGFRAVIYPPRKLDFARFPRVDAIVLSHEHSDHVSLPSLRLLDRRIPVIFPERSASAIRTVVSQLGFRVVSAAVGDRFSIGDLIISFFGGEHRDDDLEEEWATLQILVASDAGSFFTYVDSWPTETTLSSIARTVGRLGLFCHVNNTMDWSCLEGGLNTGTIGGLDYAARIIGAEGDFWREREAPELTAVCGPGLAFRGDDAWMNQILTADSERVCGALRALLPERSFSSPLPGETAVFERRRLARVEPRAPFLRALPRSRWPSRKPRTPLRLIEQFEPACGQRSLSDAEWQYLFGELQKLAAFLYGRTLFRTLHALDSRDLGRRKAAFALLLRSQDDDRAMVCEYRPDASKFELVRCASPIGVYVAGLECWATDLVRVMQGSLLPQRLLGHLRTWSFSPTPLSPLQAIWRFFDVLHRPEAATAFYAGRMRNDAERPIIAAGKAASRLKKLDRSAR